MRDALSLARAQFRDVPLYAPDRRACAVDLSDNTNLFGPPPSACRALAEAAPESVSRYPSSFATDLKTALGAYARVRPEEIVTGCGSDDVLDSALRAFAEPGDRVAYPDPTFAMVPTFARMNGLVPAPVLFGRDGDLDPAALLATGARVIYLCSPNNPTGRTLARAAIEHVIAGAPGLVILDEAYAEYVGEGWLRQAPARERLLVTRTLSKAFGLAGLRIGYAAGAAPLVTEVEKSRGPFKVGAATERAAIAALTDDRDWVEARIGEVRANCERFAGALADLGFAPLPSDANFVLVPVRDARATAEALRRRGVAVRPFAALPSIGDALRITIGPWPMMETALAALREVPA